MSTTVEAILLLRLYADEPDESFLSTAIAGYYSMKGYDQFRSFVDGINPYVLSSSVTVTMNNVRTYDLTQANAVITAVGTPSILGANPNQNDNAGNSFPIGRMTRLLAVNRLTVATTISEKFEIVENEEALMIGRNVCMLQGTNLVFSHNVVGNFQLVFSSQQTIGRATPTVAFAEPTWSNAGGTILIAFIQDNLSIFHDLIALFAMQQYAIQNGAPNPQADKQFELRKQELREYLMMRDWGSHYVHQNYNPSDPGSGVIT
jgi:hypothetical protein